MHRTPLRAFTALACLALAGCPADTPSSAGASSADPPLTSQVEAEAETEAFEAQPLEFDDWYPDAIQAPEGTEYPCALTALPKELEGIPPKERRFVNHVYACVFDSIQAKQVILQALVDGDDGLQPKLDAYLEQTRAALEKIRAEPAPPGLRPFRDQVVGAIELQQAFFTQGVAKAEEGVPLKEIYAIPEGRQASKRLLSAWSAMSRRYPSWGPEVKDSVYHHLCALDLF